MPRLNKFFGRRSTIAGPKIQDKDMENVFYFLVKTNNNEQSSTRKVYSTMNNWIYNIRRWKDFGVSVYSFYQKKGKSN